MKPLQAVRGALKRAWWTVVTVWLATVEAVAAAREGYKDGMAGRGKEDA